MKRKIYVASSWRNAAYENIVNILKILGHEVYDFRNPPKGTAFNWDQISPMWEYWNPQQSREALEHPIAQKAFELDHGGMQWADTCLMVLPCGRSANTEAGWMKGQGKTVYVLQLTKEVPELMYKLYDGILVSIEELKNFFDTVPTRELER